MKTNNDGIRSSGQDNVRFVLVTDIPIGRLLVLNNWSGPSAWVAAISAGESAAL